MYYLKIKWPRGKVSTDAFIRAVIAHRENFGHDLNYNSELVAGYTQIMTIEFKTEVELGFFLLNGGETINVSP